MIPEQGSSSYPFTSNKTDIPEYIHSVTYTWQEVGLTTPFLELKGDAKTAFSFKAQHYLNSDEFTAGYRMPIFDGMTVRPLLVRSKIRKAPLYIVPYHHYLIDILSNEDINETIGSIQFDLHRDLAETKPRLPKDAFEAAFNAELIKRNIFSPDKMVLGLPYAGEQDSNNYSQIRAKITPKKLDGTINSKELIMKTGKPFVFHIDADILRGKAPFSGKYTIEKLTPPLLIDNARIVALITSPSHIGSFSEDEIHGINNLVRRW